mmetsp:Transcript_14692/g.29676  ORF Transcript_14692/g.29676 Transcript_14692/m.29676 type:complete len:81 (-) Transcript_14692:62-304(-)
MNPPCMEKTDEERSGKRNGFTMERRSLFGWMDGCMDGLMDGGLLMWEVDRKSQANKTPRCFRFAVRLHCFFSLPPHLPKV